jgi:hypothetical protein
VALMDILQDREKLMKLMLLGFLASLVFIGIGFFIMIRDVMS